jgi:AcrR family transcriptional regulator
MLRGDDQRPAVIGSVTHEDPPAIDGRRTRHAHRRPELLAAATDYVFEHGLADLTMRPLANELGITHRGLLHHFGSKEQLVAEILHELRARDHQRTTELGGRLTATGEDPIMLAWNRMSADHRLKYWRAFFEVFGIALRDVRYAHFLDGFVSDWLELLEPLLVEQGRPAERLESVATMLLAGFRGLWMDLLVTGDRERVDAAAVDLARAVRMVTATGAKEDGRAVNRSRRGG